MVRRAVSQRLVGRDRELAELVSALADDDAERPLLLVSGEAGIGKTRLLSEVTQRLAGDDPGGPRDYRVVRGSCLRLAEGELPFAPFLEVLDGLADLDAARRTIGQLRRQLAGHGSRPDAGAQARTLWFGDVRDVLVTAAGDGHLLVILDDVHWADRSTLDLLLFLARRLRGSRVRVLVAYRSDELHRRHPLRPVLAELVGGYVQAGIELAPLDDQQVAEQVIELIGESAPDLVEAIAQRVDGNPFFVEELVALAPGSGRMPASLRDVLLARVGTADTDGTDVLGAVALIGRPVGPELIASVLELDLGAVERRLADAVDRSILVQTPGSSLYRFRHALLEEAITDDLLPDARHALHGRIARVLLARQRDDAEANGSAELARHLDLAGEFRPAADAYLEAAEASFRAFGWAEGVAAFERAWTLLERIAADDPVHGRFRALVDQAAMAMHWAQHSARAVGLLRQEAAWSEAHEDAQQAAWLLLSLARLLNDMGDEVGARSAGRRALAIGRIDLGTAIGVDLLIARAGLSWLESRYRDALADAHPAVTAAEALDDPGLLFRAHIHRAQALIGLGEIELGRADAEAARRLQAEHGWLDVYGLLSTNVGVMLQDAGLLDESLAYFEEGLETNHRVGTDAAWDAWNLPGIAMCAYLKGSWSDADAPVSAARAFGVPGMPTYFNEWVAAVLAAERGDEEAAQQACSLVQEHAPPPPGDAQAYLALAQAIVAGAAGDARARVDFAEAGLRAAEDLDTFVLRARLAVEVASGAADLAVAAREARDVGAAEQAADRARSAATLAADLDAGRIVPGVRSVAWSRANAEMAALETARAEGLDRPEAWRSVAAAFEAMGMRPRVAEARYRAARAALRDGARADAADDLVAADELARSIGMVVMERRIKALARAGRIDLEPGGPAPASTSDPAEQPWGLSVREREVLALVAAGRTNAEIADALFISPKTASVHVTHILQKLGVASRVEAALRASEAGIVG